MPFLTTLTAACVQTARPMDVRIPENIEDGQRVLSRECTLCQTSVAVCARDTQKLTFDINLGGRGLLRTRQPKMAPASVTASARE